jgi:cytidylate kinase
MTINANAEHCLSFINTQLQASDRPAVSMEKNIRRAVTISRQAGCGAFAVAEKLGRYLQEHLPGDYPWTVLDRNLIDRVLADHGLPVSMARMLPEDRVSQIEDILADVFEVHPPVQTIIEQTAETILKLAGLGNVILIGRGSTAITANLPHVLHVRLVAPLEKRVEHAWRAYSEFNKTEAQARQFCLNEDRGRERYLKKYFNTDINDPLLYHMVINTGLVSYDDAAKLIGAAVLNLKQG